MLKASNRPFQGDKVALGSILPIYGVKDNIAINVLFVQVLF